MHEARGSNPLSSTKVNGLPSAEPDPNPSADNGVNSSATHLPAGLVAM